MRRARGFSLIELIVVIVVLGTVASAGTGADQEGVDVVYQSVSNIGMFAWNNASATRRIGWRTWNPATATLSGITLTRFGAFVGCQSRVFEWLRLYARPDTDEIMAVFQNDRDFDFAWQTLASALGRGWLVWGSRDVVAGQYLATQSFVSPALPGPGGAWGPVAKIFDRTMMVKMGVMPLSGTVLAGLYQSTASASDDIQAIYADGGAAPPAWSATIPPGQTIWGGPTAVQQGERVYIETTGATFNTKIVFERQEIYP